MTRLRVEIIGEGRLEAASCDIEQAKFGVTRTSDTTFEGEHSVDVVGFMQYGAGVTADTGTRWRLKITLAATDEVVLNEPQTVDDERIISIISGMVLLP
ncbi:MAG: hypothetical protein ACO1SV_00660 [Fimbriimonas sp.]